MKISSKGMKYYCKILDERDNRIRVDWEYNIREGFDWVDENEGVKNIDELCRLRKEWLSSEEFKIFSGEMSDKDLKREILWFRSGLRWLLRKGLVIED